MRKLFRNAGVAAFLLGLTATITKPTAAKLIAIAKSIAKIINSKINSNKINCKNY